MAYGLNLPVIVVAPDLIVNVAVSVAQAIPNSCFPRAPALPLATKAPG